MSLRSFIDDADAPRYTIAVVGDDAAGPLAGMLEETLETQSIDVRADDGAVPKAALDSLEGDGDAVVLLEDDAPIAATPMAELYESLLAINSDLFVTGACGLGEIDLPDVLAGLSDTRLRLRGYPLAHKEKLLLILLSRYIEQRAWRAGHGTLRSSFQRLSRLDDEVGTADVYAELAATDVDVHLYGVDDGPTGTADELDATVHTGTTPEYRNAWFVAFAPAETEPSDDDGAALVCLETEPRVWDGFWTTDPERVAAIEAYVEREL